MSQEIKIFDWDKYPHDVIVIIKLTTAYFIDIIYNYLYLEAEKGKNSGAFKSLTEGYKIALNKFVCSFDIAKNHARYISGLHTFFISYDRPIKNSTECGCQIVKVFIPEDYFDKIEQNRKLFILIDIIKKVMKTMAVEILASDLSRVIDHHQNPDNVVLLQNKMVNAFLAEREKIYIKFLDRSDAKTDVPHSYVLKLQSQLQEMLGICTKQKERIASLVKSADEKQTEIDALNTQIRQLSNTSYIHTPVVHTPVDLVYSPPTQSAPLSAPPPTSEPPKLAILSVPAQPSTKTVRAASTALLTSAPAASPPSSAPPSSAPPSSASPSTASPSSAPPSSAPPSSASISSASPSSASILQNPVTDSEEDDADDGFNLKDYIN